MRIRSHVLMDGTPGAAGGGAAGAPAAGAEGAGAAAGTPAGEGGQPGAAAGAGEPGTSALAKPVPLAERIPAKFHVKKGEELDTEATFAKVLEGYGALEKKLGSGDGPPKAAEEYQVTIPDEIKDVVQLDETRLGAFKKDAFDAGLNQKQFDLVMGRFMKLAPELMQGALQNTTEATITNLDKAWGKEYDSQLSLASKAFDQLAGDGLKGQFDAIMTNPAIAYQVLAKIGAEMGEGGGVMPNADAASDGENIQALLTSEAAGNPKHPDHKATRAKIDAYYVKKYGNAPVT